MLPVPSDPDTQQATEMSTPRREYIAFGAAECRKALGPLLDNISVPHAAPSFLTPNRFVSVPSFVLKNAAVSKGVPQYVREVLRYFCKKPIFINRPTRELLPSLSVLDKQSNASVPNRRDSRPTSSSAGSDHVDIESIEELTDLLHRRHICPNDPLLLLNAGYLPYDDALYEHLQPPMYIRPPPLRVSISIERAIVGLMSKEILEPMWGVMTVYHRKRFRDEYRFVRAAESFYFDLNTLQTLQLFGAARPQKPKSYIANSRAFDFTIPLDNDLNIADLFVVMRLEKIMTNDQEAMHSFYTRIHELEKEALAHGDIARNYINYQLGLKNEILRLNSLLEAHRLLSAGIEMADAARKSSQMQPHGHSVCPPQVFTPRVAAGRSSTAGKDLRANDSESTLKPDASRRLAPQDDEHGSGPPRLSKSDSTSAVVSASVNANANARISASIRAPDGMDTLQMRKAQAARTRKPSGRAEKSHKRQAPDSDDVFNVYGCYADELRKEYNQYAAAVWLQAARYGAIREPFALGIAPLNLFNSYVVQESHAGGGAQNPFLQQEGVPHFVSTVYNKMARTFHGYVFSDHDLLGNPVAAGASKGAGGLPLVPEYHPPFVARPAQSQGLTCSPLAGKGLTHIDPGSYRQVVGRLQAQTSCSALEYNVLSSISALQDGILSRQRKLDAYAIQQSLGCTPESLAMTDGRLNASDNTGWTKLSNKSNSSIRICSSTAEPFDADPAGRARAHTSHAGSSLNASMLSKHQYNHSALRSGSSIGARIADDAGEPVLQATPSSNNGSTHGSTQGSVAKKSCSGLFDFDGDKQPSSSVLGAAERAPAAHSRGGSTLSGKAQNSSHLGSEHLSTAPAAAEAEAEAGDIASPDVAVVNESRHHADGRDPAQTNPFRRRSHSNRLEQTQVPGLALSASTQVGHGSFEAATAKTKSRRGTADTARSGAGETIAMQLGDTPRMIYGSIYDIDGASDGRPSSSARRQTEQSASVSSSLLEKPLRDDNGFGMDTSMLHDLTVADNPTPPGRSFDGANVFSVQYAAELADASDTSSYSYSDVDEVARGSAPTSAGSSVCSLSDESSVEGAGVGAGAGAQPLRPAPSTSRGAEDSLCDQFDRMLRQGVVDNPYSRAGSEAADRCVDVTPFTPCFVGNWVFVRYPRFASGATSDALLNGVYEDILAGKMRSLAYLRVDVHLSTLNFGRVWPDRCSLKIFSETPIAHTLRPNLMPDRTHQLEACMVNYCKVLLSRNDSAAVRVYRNLASTGLITPQLLSLTAFLGCHTVFENIYLTRRTAENCLCAGHAARVGDGYAQVLEPSSWCHPEHMYTRELDSFLSYGPRTPDFCYRNRLYVYPELISTAGLTNKSARNIIIRAELRIDDTLKPLDTVPSLYPRYHGIVDIFSVPPGCFEGDAANVNIAESAFKYRMSQLTSGTYHSRLARFYDEFKFELPLAITEKMHILFTIYQVSVSDSTRVCSTDLLQTLDDTIVPNGKLPFYREYAQSRNLYGEARMALSEAPPFSGMGSIRSRPQDADTAASASASALPGGLPPSPAPPAPPAPALGSPRYADPLVRQLLADRSASERSPVYTATGHKYTVSDQPNSSVGYFGTASCACDGFYADGDGRGTHFEDIAGFVPITKQGVFTQLGFAVLPLIRSYDFTTAIPIFHPEDPTSYPGQPQGAGQLDCHEIPVYIPITAQLNPGYLSRFSTFAESRASPYLAVTLRFNSTLFSHDYAVNALYYGFENIFQAYSDSLSTSKFDKVNSYMDQLFAIVASFFEKRAAPGPPSSTGASNGLQAFLAMQAGAAHAAAGHLHTKATDKTRHKCVEFVSRYPIILQLMYKSASMVSSMAKDKIHPTRLVLFYSRLVRLLKDISMFAGQTVPNLDNYVLQCDVYQMVRSLKIEHRLSVEYRVLRNFAFTHDVNEFLCSILLHEPFGANERCHRALGPGVGALGAEHAGGTPDAGSADGADGTDCAEDATMYPLDRYVFHLLSSRRSEDDLASRQTPYLLQNTDGLRALYAHVRSLGGSLNYGVDAPLSKDTFVYRHNFFHPYISHLFHPVSLDLLNSYISGVIRTVSLKSTNASALNPADSITGTAYLPNIYFDTQMIARGIIVLLDEYARGLCSPTDHARFEGDLFVFYEHIQTFFQAVAETFERLLEQPAFDAAMVVVIAETLARLCADLLDRGTQKEVFDCISDFVNHFINSYNKSTESTALLRLSLAQRHVVLPFLKTLMCHCNAPLYALGHLAGADLLAGLPYEGITLGTVISPRSIIDFHMYQACDYAIKTGDCETVAYCMYVLKEIYTVTTLDLRNITTNPHVLRHTGSPRSARGTRDGEDASSSEVGAYDEPRGPAAVAGAGAVRGVFPGDPVPPAPQAARAQSAPQAQPAQLAQHSQAGENGAGGEDAQGQESVHEGEGGCADEGEGGDGAAQPGPSLATLMRDIVLESIVLPTIILIIENADNIFALRSDKVYVALTDTAPLTKEALEMRKTEFMSTERTASAVFVWALNYLTRHADLYYELMSKLSEAQHYTLLKIFTRMLVLFRASDLAAAVVVSQNHRLRSRTSDHLQRLLASLRLKMASLPAEAPSPLLYKRLSSAGRPASDHWRNDDSQAGPPRESGSAGQRDPPCTELNTPTCFVSGSQDTPKLAHQGNVRAGGGPAAGDLSSLSGNQVSSHQDTSPTNESHLSTDYSSIQSRTALVMPASLLACDLESMATTTDKCRAKPFSAPLRLPQGQNGLSEPSSTRNAGTGAAMKAEKALALSSDEIVHDFITLLTNALSALVDNQKWNSSKTSRDVRRGLRRAALPQPQGAASQQSATLRVRDSAHDGPLSDLSGHDSLPTATPPNSKTEVSTIFGEQSLQSTMGATSLGDTTLRSLDGYPSRGGVLDPGKGAAQPVLTIRGSAAPHKNSLDRQYDVQQSSNLSEIIADARPDPLEGPKGSSPTEPVSAMYRGSGRLKPYPGYIDEGMESVNSETSGVNRLAASGDDSVSDTEQGADRAERPGSAVSAARRVDDAAGGSSSRVTPRGAPSDQKKASERSQSKRCPDSARSLRHDTARNSEIEASFNDYGGRARPGTASRVSGLLPKRRARRARADDARKPARGSLEFLLLKDRDSAGRKRASQVMHSTLSKKGDNAGVSFDSASNSLRSSARRRGSDTRIATIKDAVDVTSTLLSTRVFDSVMYHFIKLLIFFGNSLAMSSLGSLESLPCASHDDLAAQAGYASGSVPTAVGAAADTAADTGIERDGSQNVGRLAIPMSPRAQQAPRSSRSSLGWALRPFNGTDFIRYVCDFFDTAFSTSTREADIVFQCKVLFNFLPSAKAYLFNGASSDAVGSIVAGLVRQMENKSALVREHVAINLTYLLKDEFEYTNGNYISFVKANSALTAISIDAISQPLITDTLERTADIVSSIADAFLARCDGYSPDPPPLSRQHSAAPSLSAAASQQSMSRASLQQLQLQQQRQLATSFCTPAALGGTPVVGGVSHVPSREGPLPAYEKALAELMVAFRDSVILFCNRLRTVVADEFKISTSASVLTTAPAAAGGKAKDAAQPTVLYQSDLYFELLLSQANCYNGQPETRYTSLQKLHTELVRTGRFVEAGKLSLLMAALIAEFLYVPCLWHDPGVSVAVPARRATQRTNYVIFDVLPRLRKILPNLTLQSDFSVLARVLGPQHTDPSGGAGASTLEAVSPGSLRDLFDKLDGAVTSFRKAQYHEYAADVLQLMTDMLVKYAPELCLESKQALLYPDMLSESLRETLLLPEGRPGSYFRIAFYGRVFGEALDGKEYIYFEASKIHITEISNRLSCFYTVKYPGIDLRIGGDPSEVEGKSATGLIQISPVTPYTPDDYETDEHISTLISLLCATNPAYADAPSSVGDSGALLETALDTAACSHREESVLRSESSMLFLAQTGEASAAAALEVCVLSNMMPDGRQGGAAQPLQPVQPLQPAPQGQSEQPEQLDQSAPQGLRGAHGTRSRGSGMLGPHTASVASLLASQTLVASAAAAVQGLAKPDQGQCQGQSEQGPRAGAAGVLPLYTLFTSSSFYIDSLRLPRVTPFERSTGIHIFERKVPYRVDEAKKDAVENVGRADYFHFVAEPFPFYVTRQEILHTKKIVVPPIGAATESLVSQTQKMQTLIAESAINVDRLQHILMGDVMVLVHEGPLYIAEKFLPRQPFLCSIEPIERQPRSPKALGAKLPSFKGVIPPKRLAQTIQEKIDARVGGAPPLQMFWRPGSVAQSAHDSMVNIPTVSLDDIVSGLSSTHPGAAGGLGGAGGPGIPGSPDSPGGLAPALASAKVNSSTISVGTLPNDPSSEGHADPFGDAAQRAVHAGTPASEAPAHSRKRSSMILPDDLFSPDVKAASLSDIRESMDDHGSDGPGVAHGLTGEAGSDASSLGHDAQEPATGSSASVLMLRMSLKETPARPATADGSPGEPMMMSPGSAPDGSSPTAAATIIRVDEDSAKVPRLPLSSLLKDNSIDGHTSARTITDSFYEDSHHRLPSVSDANLTDGGTSASVSINRSTDRPRSYLRKIRPLAIPETAVSSADSTDTGTSLASVASVSAGLIPVKGVTQPSTTRNSTHRIALQQPPSRPDLNALGTPGRLEPPFLEKLEVLVDTMPLDEYQQILKQAILDFMLVHADAIAVANRLCRNDPPHFELQTNINASFSKLIDGMQWYVELPVAKLKSKMTAE